MDMVFKQGEKYMTQTKIAEVVKWHKKPKEPKPKHRLDVKFEEWAKRNNVDIKNIKLMEKKNG